MKLKLTTLQDMAQAGVTPVWLLREKVTKGYYFYLEWPVKDQWKVMARFGDRILARCV